MIRYPLLEPGATIGVTAPSSGVSPDMHELLKQAMRRMENQGFAVSGGDTIWTQYKAKSAPARLRAEELNRMLQEERIGLVLPPWGGELLVEVLEYIDYERIGEKWLLGYSDISLLLLAVTLKTGIATAHGTNLLDLRSEIVDETTAKWHEALTTPAGGSFEQRSSELYQIEWKAAAEEAGADTSEESALRLAGASDGDAFEAARSATSGGDSFHRTETVAIQDGTFGRLGSEAADGGLFRVSGPEASRNEGAFESARADAPNESSFNPTVPETSAGSVFNLTEPTVWRSVSGSDVGLKGRLLGGCIDVIRHLVGTPYGDVRAFRERHIPGEPVLWYLENCELNTADLRRSLVQMKLAGWFENCSGLMFGRSPANTPVDGYTAEDVYRDMSEELGVPVLYDIDCGHMPPQLTLINGAMAQVEFSEEKGRASVLQIFK
ncbi:S66 peptidase family protein [Saccharibacillus sacchari]|uniref:S66 peptidase family protein n=1 Tax=Saccharibacillus sacchari TaxID=456493 RepID=A0ACC6PDV5_9BACL